MASAVTLILIGRSGGPPAAAQGALRSVARSAFVPVEAAGDAAFRPLEGATRGLGRAGELARLEAELTRQQEQARSEAARADGLATENSRLAALLGLEGPAAGDGVAARVVSTGGGGAGGTLVIDRGGAAGIEVGMPVIAAGGLVGRVVEVGPGHSTVLPVTDPASAVGVRCDAMPQPQAEPVGAELAPAAGVAQGHGGPTLRLDLLDPTTRLQSGGLAVTSGVRHSRFPAGLPVGRVTGSPGRFVVEPFAPPDRLELVKVLRWKPEP
ncbi:MAG TPA: rod shape-determining protein MreC [Acidimicrobiia bacterium]|nr:rod shape-determining protein MreC [Acidimicrobiia bacterium]